MKISELSKKYVFTSKIELDEENYIELREPTQAEIVKLSDNNTKNLELMSSLFPKCVIASSFENEDGTTCTGEQLYNELKKSGSLFTEILTTWLESVPFQSRLKKSEK